MSDEQVCRLSKACVQAAVAVQGESPLGVCLAVLNVSALTKPVRYGVLERVHEDLWRRRAEIPYAISNPHPEGSPE